MSNTLSVNNSDIVTLQSKFDQLETKQQKKVIKSALSAAGGILRKETQRQLGVKRGRSRKDLVKGVRVRSIVTDKTKRAVVHIMGDYRLKWIELGTAPRYNRYKKRNKGGGKEPLSRKRYTGEVKAQRFFATAQSTSQSKVFAEMQSRLEKNIMKIWEK